MTLTFNPLGALVVMYTHAKDEGQRSIGSNNRMETKGQTDERTESIALPSWLTRLVKTTWPYFSNVRSTFPYFNMLTIAAPCRMLTSTSCQNGGRLPSWMCTRRWTTR